MANVFVKVNVRQIVCSREPLIESGGGAAYAKIEEDGQNEFASPLQKPGDFCPLT
jgi:hypothetical protein